MSSRQSVRLSLLTKATAGLALAVAGLGSAHAVDTTWNFGGLSGSTVYSGCSDLACAGTTFTGLSNAVTQNSTGSNYNVDNRTTDFTSASVYSWGSNGLGVVKTPEESASSNGPHAIDNVYGTDAVVIGFGALKVNLNSLTVGWNGSEWQTGNGSGGRYTDSDLSVFAWVGSAAMSTANVSPDDLKAQSDALSANTITSGWKLIGNYADVGNNTNNSQGVASTIYSSNWLISAYSGAYGNTNSNTRTGTALDGFNDEFKLLALKAASCDQRLTGNSCGPGQVPEPSGLMLLGLGLLGLATSRKWHQSKQSSPAQGAALAVA